jgi:hypothetical protein
MKAPARHALAIDQLSATGHGQYNLKFRPAGLPFMA